MKLETSTTGSVILNGNPTTKRQAVQFQIRKLFNKEFITIGASIVFLLLAIFIETSGP